MNNHMSSARIFDNMFRFLHTKYFSRVAFGPVYLSDYKTHMFTDSLEIVGFTGSSEGLRPAAKHREKTMQ